MADHFAMHQIDGVFGDIGCQISAAFQVFGDAQKVQKLSGILGISLNMLQHQMINIAVQIVYHVSFRHTPAAASTSSSTKALMEHSSIFTVASCIWKMCGSVIW